MGQKARLSYLTSAPPAQLRTQHCETKPRRNAVTYAPPASASRRHALRPHRSFPEIERDCCYFSPLTRHFHMADDELVDPKKYLEEGCKPKCVKPLLEYQACIKRIEGDESGHKHCTGQYFDYWSCIDKCVAPKLFMKVK